MKTSHLGRAIVVATLLASVGCTSLRGIPANRLPPPLLGETRNDLEPIDFVRLRQDPPDVYLLAARDILGVQAGSHPLHVHEEPMATVDQNLLPDRPRD